VIAAGFLFLCQNPALEPPSPETSTINTRPHRNANAFPHRAEKKHTRTPLPKVKKNAISGEPFSWHLSDDIQLSGAVDSVVFAPHSSSFSVNLDNNIGRLVYTENEFRKRAHVFYNGSTKALKLETVKGRWVLEETNINRLRCTNGHAKFPMLVGMGYPKYTKQQNANRGASPSNTQTAPAPFQSRPSARAVIYCDFDGESVNQPYWSSSTINAAAAPLSDAQIAEVLRMVADDFAPFDVNVTNVRSVFDNTPSNLRTMCVVTNTDTASPGAGGVAGVDTFQDDLVCWCFNTANAKSCADTISHEVGHTLNLRHDGLNSQEYHPGHPSDSGEWGPIMGAAFEAPIVQWNNGSYTGATETEDDFANITSAGLSYIPDDYGDSEATAHPLTVGSTSSETITGLIDHNTDIDVFLVTFSSFGRLEVAGTDVDTIARNLDMRLQILNSADQVLLDFTDDDTLQALGNLILEPGDYEIRVSGDSTGTPNGATANGWTNYGSVGRYTLVFTPDKSTTINPAVEYYNAINNTFTHPWFSQETESNDGEDAAQAAPIDDSESSTFSITANTRTISFDYKVSSEEFFDYFEFRINGNLQQRWSGEVGWTRYNSSDLGPGPHTFTWTYNKDYTQKNGQDTAWVDQITIDGGTGLAKWANDNSVSATGTDDSDQDGNIDLVEYALLGNPNDRTEAALLALSADDNKVTFKRSPENRDLIIKLQISEDLETWTTVGASYEGQVFAASNGITVNETTQPNGDVHVEVTLAVSSGTRRFARVSLTRY